ncbi:Linear gramicidin synthase subunit D [Serratia fonticola]|uniref:non-ribosomal peptide synthetase n=1 Tax=Serratia fonticola TaxID=47917 RepID=UPI002183CC6F|nr:amino acid adenylation domain-containing protein [Serratia fonticola]CAI2415503.1 Linear gramicidin synthase subunit D [Serratia fonticola]
MDTKFNSSPELSCYQPTGFLQRFFMHVDNLPDKIAIITPEKMLTYHVLAKQAAIIAQILQSKGVTRETPVAILLPPGIEQIISQTGILIAQGSCVPLDPNMPEERLNDMLNDLQIQWTIVTSREKHKNLHTTLLDFHDLTLNQQHITSTYDDISPEHRTHILFTSGTTGKPKAVEIEAKGILRLVVNTCYINLTIDDRIACIANPTFDASLFEIWGALLNGATTVIIPKEDVLNIQYFQQELIRQKITIMFITTSLFNLVATTFPQAFRFFRYLLVGGEALNPHTLKLILNTAPPQHLLNAYGPTESTTFAMTHDIQTDDLTSGSVPIGKPIDRTTAFILDDCLQPVVQGDVGHLYIGGDGLARGYWNRDALNKERFVSVSLPGYSTPLRLYQTGDLSLQRDDGVFMYYGRIDNQVKIRGHRIELEEIECQVIKSGQVKATSVILVKKENAEPFLAAFIVPLNSSSFRTDILEEKLHQYLPEYMLPRLFVVDTIPLTPTGKTDKQRLLMKLVESTATFERPDMFNDTEYALLLIWQKILNKAEIGLDDNFFRLGGSSLQAASLVIELGRQFTRHFSVQTLYDAPTLRKLANIISQKNVTHQQDEVAQWLQDAKLPDDIQALSGDLQNWSTLKDATVMLTGATGYLGAFFLRDLLATPNIKQVICLIRATDEMTARLRIQQNLLQYGLWDPVLNQRITIITGDLSLPKLGLNDDLYHSLAVESDAIFHLGAHVNYIQPYQAHRAGNIEGTLNILRLATQSKPKPLHYVSTIAAYGPAGLFNKVSRIYENDDLTLFLEGLKYDSGYSQSQWVVEQFVWEANKRGIPLSVYRPGFIIGDSVNGRGNPKDFVSRLIRGCIAIGAHPILPHQRKEFIPVDYVSAALLTIAKDNNNLGQAYHLVPPNHAQSIDLDQFFDLICKSGYRLQKLPYSEWITRLDADPELYDNPLMPLLPMLSETVYQKQTRWEVYENMPAYDASNTQAALAAANCHLKFTPMDKHLLLLHLDFWRRNGLLPGNKN